MSPARSLRLDLQGARGLGVSLVVIGHLFLWPSGVFAALDIFFVLSGFLITAILVPSFEKHGARFFVGFYLARVRRLVPMAVLVLAFTVVGTYAVYSGARATLVGQDALWALFFAVNWHFASQGTDYFALQSASPLQHYWSLSVEEQFYLGWPLLVFVGLGLAGWLARRAGRSGRTPPGPTAVVAQVLGTVTVATFGYSLWHSAAAPLASYFSTFDRAWEFGAGGLLALAAPVLVRLPRPVRVAMSWVGTLGVLVTIFALDPTVSFPAPWGLLPVALTAMIIVGGLDGRTEHLVLLHNPVMIYLGNISYSVYLWHLPLNVLLEPYFAPDSTAFYVAALVSTLVLSVVSYQLVERPLRYAPWLMTAPERRARRDRPMYSPRVRRAARAVSGWAAIGGLMLAMLPVVLFLQGGTGATAPGDDTTVVQPVALVADQQQRLRDALAADGFPDLDLGALSSTTWEAEHAEEGCVDVDPDDLAACRYGPDDATKVVAVVGDSIAVTWMPAVRDAFLAKGWAVQQLTLTQCTTWTLPGYLKRDGSTYPECARMHRVVQQYVRDEEPDLVILASSYDQVLNATRDDLPDGLSGNPVATAQVGLTGTIKRLRHRGTDLVVLGPPVPHESLVDCVTRSGGPEDCASLPSQNWFDHVAGETAAAEDTRVPYVRTEDWFCVQGGRCPGFVGTTPVTVDGIHLSVGWSHELSSLLAGALLPRPARR